MQKSLRIFLIIWIMVTGAISAQAQKIMGYVEDYRYSNITDQEYAALTDVIYSFLNFNTDGSIITYNNTDQNFGWNQTAYATVKSKCKTKKNSVNGPKLHIALGGADKNGVRSNRFYQVASNATTRQVLVNQVVNWAIQEGIYGIAVDWEFPSPSQTWAHEELMKDFRTAINNSSDPSLILTIDVGGEWKNTINHLQYVTQNALSYIDELHIMSYDLPTSYSANHSSIADAKGAMDQWNLTYGFPYNKMLIGLPFYGWDGSRNSNRMYSDEGSYITAYNKTDEGAVNGYYYNSKDAFTKKINYVYQKGGQGVVIWAIGHDRQLPDQYSMLGAVKAATDAACQAPQPNLGPDAGVCLTTTPGGMTLNSGVSAQAGRTFVWKRDGVTISGSGPTLSGVTTSGTYSVTVTQGGCTRTDDIIVTSSNAVSATGGSVCGSGQVTLTANGSGTFNWYDNSVGGTMLATGSTYSPNVSTTTDFYVQDAGNSVTHTTGKLVMDNTKASLTPFGRSSVTGRTDLGHKIVVSASLKIASVDFTIAPNMTGSLSVNVVSSADNKTVLQTVGPFSYSTGGSQQILTLPLNLNLAPGTYYLVPVSTTGTDQKFWAEVNWAATSLLPDYTVSGVIAISGNCFNDFNDGLGVRTPANAAYLGSLFNWVIVTGSANACGRTKVTATVNPGPTQPGNFTSSTASVCQGQTGVVFTVPNDPSVTYQWSYTGTGATFATGQGTNSVTVNFAANATNGNISVVAKKTGCGDSPARTLAVSVNPASTASVTIAASETTICSGTSVTFTATPVNGGATPGYQWKLNGNNIAGATSATYTTTSLNNGDKVSVVMTASGTCITGSPATSSQVTITVNPASTASVTIAASETTICSGTTVTFTATPVNGGATPSYQWKLNGNNIAGATSATYTTTSLNNGDKVSVVMTASGTCVTGSPATSSQVTITVNPASTASVTIVASETAICPGTSVTFTATPVNGGATPSYQWKLNGNNIAGATSATYTTTSLNNGDKVSVVMTASGTCITGSPATSSQVTITVNPASTASVTIAASETTICSGTSVTFTATPVNGGATPGYQWKLNGNNIAGATSATYTTTSLNNGDKVSVVMTANGTCISGSPATSSQVTITVNPASTASVTIAASETTICSGTSVTFTATPVNGGATPGYQWKLNGNNIAGATSATYTTTSLNNGDKVSVVMTASGTCITGSPATSSQVTITVNPASTASVTIAASETTICPGTSVTFTATPVNGGASASYQWKLNGNNIAGATSATYSTTSLNNGDKVSVVMTANGTCITGSPATSSQVTITVNPASTASVTIAASETTICPGTSVTFTATPVNGGATPSYQWKLNGNNIAGATSATYTTTSLNNGDKVSVVMTANGACISGSPATSSAVTITVSPSTTASVTIAASETTICPGTNVTFTATPVGGGASPTYQWKLNGNDVGTGGSTFTSSTLANGDKVRVVMTSNSTCATGSPATSNEVVMIVNNSATASVNITASATTICSGASVTFNAVPTNGGAAPTYQWKVNNSDVGTGSSYTTSSLVNGDKVSVVMTSNASCVSGSPATSTPITMTVNPSLPASVQITANSTTICTGTTVTFTANPTNGGVSPTYQWKLNGGNVGTGSTYTNSTLNHGDRISVVMTSNATCVTGSPAQSNEIVMTVDNSQIASVSISTPQTTVCAGTQVTFTATPTNGGTAPTYQWKLNNNDVGSGGSTFTTTTLATGDKVSVVMTSNASCASGSPATSNVITMTVTPSVAATIQISPDLNNVCAGTPVTFTASITNGGTSPAYQWKVNGNDVGSSTTTFSSSSLNNGDIVTCVLTSNLPCATNSPVTSNSITMVIKPMTTASVSIISSATTICAGENVTFTATPENGGTSPVYQWKVNNSDIVNSGATFTSSTLNNGDQVSVVMTSNAECVTGSPATSNITTINVTPSGTASVAVTASSTSICTGTTVNFTATPTNGGSSPVYQWKLNGNTVGDNTPNYSNSTLANGDKVSVIMTSNAACVTGSPATSDEVIMSVTSGGVVAVSITATSTSICQGSSVTFSASPENGGSAPVYQWKINGLVVGPNTSTFTTSSIANGDLVTCQLTSNLGCISGSSTATSNTLTMSVIQNVPASVSIAANATTICAGTQVTFNATPTNGGTNPVYQWKVNGNVEGSTSSTFTSSTLANGDVVTCEMVSNAQCVTGSPATSNPVSITVTTSVIASVSITSSATTICSGTDVTFTANAQNGGGNPTYQWKLNGTDVVSNGTTYSNANLVNGDKVSVVMTSSLGCATNSPATSNVITMTVNQSVVAGIQITSTANSICEGAGVTFSATATNPGTLPVYQWKLNDVNVGNNSTTFSSTNIKNGDKVVCILTSNAACVSGSPARSNEITMTVNPGGPAAVSIAASSTNICPGASVTFTASPTNGGTSPSYQWKVNNNNVGNDQPTYTTTTLSNNDIVTVVMTSSLSCATGSPATSNSLAITVTPGGQATILISTPTTEICSGTQVTFTATSTFGGNAPTYQWKVNGVNAGNNSPNFSPLTLTNGAVVSCVMTSSISCATGSPATSNEITMTVNQSVNASVNINASANNICKGETVNFTATGQNGGATPTYQWKINGVNVGNNVPTYSSSTLVNGDVVTCVFTSSNGCANNSPATSNTVTMAVNSRTPQPGAFTQGLSNVRQGQTGVVYTVPNVPGVTYKWMYYGNGVTINGTGNSVTLDFAANATNGSLYVSADDGKCGESYGRTMAIIVEVVGAVSKANGAVYSLSSYPNPFSENATITYQLVKGSKVSMTLQDIIGGEMQILIDEEYQTEGEYDIQVPGLPAGVYIIQLSADGAIATHKMIKVE